MNGRVASAFVMAGALAAGPASAAEFKDGWEVVRTPVKAFAVTDLEGRTLRSSELKGRVVVADFWATWCGPCLRELPDIQALTERWKGRADVAFLSFDATEDKEEVVAFVKEKDIRYPVYLADDLVGPFDVGAFPTKVIIDLRGPGAGVVRFRRDGYTEVKSLEARVQALLDEKPSATAR